MNIPFLLPVQYARGVKTGLLILLLIALGHQVQSQDCHQTLYGQVKQAGSHEPLAFANMFIRETGARINTDAQGNYAFQNLCDKRVYHIEISYLSRVFAVDIAASDQAFDIEFPDDNVLEAVVVTGKAAVAVHTEAACTVDHLDFASKQAMNLGEIVKQLPGVTTLQTGANISKPVIQGLHSNRVAIVNNNVVLESQQWGQEHAPEIDPFSSEKVTVVKGAEGVRYGVGAMAGAIVLEPAPLREKQGWGGWAAAGGFSNGYSGVLAGAVDYRTPNEKWAFRLQSSAKRGGNLRAPDYWLYNTGHAEFNVSALMQWKQNERSKHELSFSRIDQKLAILKASHLGNVDQILAATQLDTPINNIDRFTYAINRPYQSIQHYTVKYRYAHIINDFWKWTAQYSYQFNQRQEYDVVRKTGVAAERPQASFRLFTNTLDLGIEQKAKRYWQTEGGIQLLTAQNYTNRGAFIPNYMGLGASVWAHERWRKHEVPWEWEIGGRYDYRYSHVYTQGNFSRDINKNVQFGNVSGVTGVHYHFNKAIALTLHSGYAWRPPSVYELFAKGVHHGAGTYEEGDSSLISEKSLNTNLTLDVTGVKYKGFRGSLTLYRNQVNDFIYLDPQNTIKITVRGPFPAYYYQQADAVLQGIDALADFPIYGGLTLETRASLIRAWRKLDSPHPESGKMTDPLPLMPSDRYQYGLRWTSAGTGNSTLRLMGNTILQQTRIPAEGLLKAPPPAFTTFSFDATHTFHIDRQKNGKAINRVLELGLTMQNLTNVRYREYLNFFRYYADEPGFNAGLRVKLTF